MKHNYIDGKGVYHNELNLTLAQIYDSGVEFGHSVAKEEFVKELENMHKEISERLKTKDESQFDLGRKSELAYLGNLIYKRISELKGEQE